MPDYIERDVAISAAIDAVDEWDGGPNRSRWEKINNAMEAIPAANVREVVKARNKSASGFLCSACGFGDFGGFHGYKPNYCPNCGAKMMEPPKEEK